MFPLPAAHIHSLTFHQRVLSRRRFILPLLLIIGLIGVGGAAQAQDLTPTPVPLRIASLSFNSFTLAWDDITGNKGSSE